MITKINKFKKILEYHNIQSIEFLLDENPELLESDIAAQTFYVNNEKILTFEETGLKTDKENYISWDELKSINLNTWTEIYDWLNDELIEIYNDQE